MGQWDYLHEKAAEVWVDAIQLIAEYCPQWTDDRMENLGFTILLVLGVLLVMKWWVRNPNGNRKL